MHHDSDHSRRIPSSACTMKSNLAGLLDAIRSKRWLTASLLLLAPCPLFSQGIVETWIDPYFGSSTPLTGSPTHGGFAQVSAGYNHSLALHHDGSITSWGWPTWWVVSESPPGNGFSYVEGGFYISIALRTDGSLYAWGNPDHPIVRDLPSVTGLVEVAAGTLHAVALRADGTLFSWGSDERNVVSNTPTQAGFTQVDAAESYSVALRADGSIVAWGSDEFGMVSGIPTATGFTQLAVARTHGLALRADGSIEHWGYGGYVYDHLPQQGGFVQLATANDYAIALTSAGTLRVWGDYESTPTNIPLVPTVTAIAAGNQHAVALLDDGAGYSYCYGDGSGSACPCGGAGATGRGCPNSGTLNGARLQGFGSANLSGSNFRLEGTGLPNGHLGLILQGSTQLGGGRGTPLGDGLLCLGGQTSRSHVQAASQWGYMAFTDFAGSSFASVSNGPGAMTYYQLWYRDPVYTCSGAAFNFSNGWTVNWIP